MAADIEPEIVSPIVTEKITTSSAPSPDEEYLPPPGMPSPPKPTPEVAGESKKSEEPSKDKIQWDYAKLLQGGTLGDLSANLHHGVAVGTDWNGWELTDSEKNQYDKILGMILEPLLQKVEYLPLVLGVLALVSIEGWKIGNYMKFNKERKEKEAQKVPNVINTTSVPAPPNAPITPTTVTSPPPPTMPPSPFDNQAPPDIGLPPLGRATIEDNLGLPPAQRLRPPGM
jgi:hypothetical protein